MIKVNVTKFRSHYADANPEWLVTEKRGRGTWIATVIDCPDYAGAKQAFTTEQIEGSRGMSRLFQNLAHESDKFFASLPIGSIVHYNNGFNQYVRCKVTSGNNLLPIALVGNWSPHDLPRRHPNGYVQEGYHVSNIKNKKVFTPNASCVYEHKHDANAVDPRGLAPLSLELPPITAAENVIIKKHQRLESIQKIVNQNIDPDAIFAQLENFLDPNAL